MSTRTYNKNTRVISAHEIMDANRWRAELISSWSFFNESSTFFRIITWESDDNEFLLEISVWKYPDGTGETCRVIAERTDRDKHRGLRYDRWQHEPSTENVEHVVQMILGVLTDLLGRMMEDL